jgi:hypothetical protein
MLPCRLLPYTIPMQSTQYAAFTWATAQLLKAWRTDMPCAVHAGRGAAVLAAERPRARQPRSHPLGHRHVAHPRGARAACMPSLTCCCNQQSPLHHALLLKGSGGCAVHSWGKKRCGAFLGKETLQALQCGGYHSALHARMTCCAVLQYNSYVTHYREADCMRQVSRHPCSDLATLTARRTGDWGPRSHPWTPH